MNYKPSFKATDEEYLKLLEQSFNKREILQHSDNNS
jgi:hypothetical protein